MGSLSLKEEFEKYSKKVDMLAPLEIKRKK